MARHDSTRRHGVGNPVPEALRSAPLRLFALLAGVGLLWLAFTILSARYSNLDAISRPVSEIQWTSTHLELLTPDERQYIADFVTAQYKLRRLLQWSPLKYTDWQALVHDLSELASQVRSLPSASCPELLCPVHETFVNKASFYGSECLKVASFAEAWYRREGSALAQQVRRGTLSSEEADTELSS